MAGIRKTEIVTLRRGKTPLLACPDWIIKSIEETHSTAGHPEDSYYFRVSVEGNAITYRPIVFGAVNDCKVCDGEHQ